jgi:hypothetical protein
MTLAFNPNPTTCSLNILVKNNSLKSYPIKIFIPNLTVSCGSALINLFLTPRHSSPLILFGLLLHSNFRDLLLTTLQLDEFYILQINCVATLKYTKLQA